MKNIDRWDLLTAAGAALLGGGVWAQWGAPWACMLWGGLLIALAGFHAANSARRMEG